jgi:lactoylglutathione lyase
LPKAILEKAWGYQGDNMNLPVRDVAAALPFYETILGVRVLSRSYTPHDSAVLARDQVRIGLAENGGDPTQDGCAFHVKDLPALFAEFKANGLQKEFSESASNNTTGSPGRCSSSLRLTAFAIGSVSGRLVSACQGAEGALRRRH